MEYKARKIWHVQISKRCLLTSNPSPSETTRLRSLVPAFLNWSHQRSHLQDFHWKTQIIGPGKPWDHWMMLGLKADTFRREKIKTKNLIKRFQYWQLAFFHVALKCVVRCERKRRGSYLEKKYEWREGTCQEIASEIPRVRAALFSARSKHTEDKPSPSWNSLKYLHLPGRWGKTAENESSIYQGVRACFPIPWVQLHYLKAACLS